MMCFFCFFFFFLLHFFVLLSFSFQMFNIWLRSSWLGVFPARNWFQERSWRLSFFPTSLLQRACRERSNKHHLEAFPHADWSFTKAFHWDDPGWVWMAQHCSLSTIIDDSFLILEYTILYWLSCFGWSIFLKKHPAFSWCVWFSCYQIWNKASHAGMLWSCDSFNLTRTLSHCHAVV